MVMNLEAEQISQNWDKFMGIIDSYITGERKEKLKKFYLKYQDRIMLMPASHKKEYHNAFAGGYVDHVIRVIEAALAIEKVWVNFEVDNDTYTIEELVFSALNHDLGKIGDEENEAYIPQTDAWRKEKLGEDYTFNTKVPFASVPDRGLFLLQSHGISYSFNEMITIQTHDGLYDEANKKYLFSFAPEQKPRTALPFIVHQADLLAARIEWEKLYLNKFKSVGSNIQDKKVVKPAVKTKALGNIKSDSLKSMLDKI